MNLYFLVNSGVYLAFKYNDSVFKFLKLVLIQQTSRFYCVKKDISYGFKFHLFNIIMTICIYNVDHRLYLFNLVAIYTVVLVICKGI